jgi:gluconate 2-dehydrogenase gamma chain
MSGDDNDGLRNAGRREMLKRVGAAGATVAVATTELVRPADAAEPHSAHLPAREALETLTAVESDTLEAIVARLIPSDESGPGAAEARAAHYIDRALTGPLAAFRQTYTAGLAAVNDYAQASKGAAYAKLTARDQDAVLTDMEKNTATGFSPNSAAFFGLLRTHTIQGTFCDPYYGGNANFVGWDLIAYPGVRLAVTADDQRMSAAPKANRKSAYDESMFEKRGGGHGH